jgi:hypothetical protein
MSGMTLRFPDGELNEEQKSLILEAGQAHGIEVRTNDAGDLAINHLTTREFAQIAHASAEQWGIPYNGVRLFPVEE